MKHIRLETYIFVGLCGFLLALAVTINYRRAVDYMFSDEAVYYMMAQSVVYDRDLEYTQRDLRRVYDDGWQAGPQGVFLTKTENGHIYYSKSLVYALFLAPFIAVFGFEGFLVFNMLLLLGMIWMGWRYLRQFNPSNVALLLAVTFFLLSASFVYTFWITPETFNMFCITLGLFLWLYQKDQRTFSQGVDRAQRRGITWLLTTPEGRVYLAPIPIGIACASKLPNALFILPIVADVAVEGFQHIFRPQGEEAGGRLQLSLPRRPQAIWQGVRTFVGVCLVFWVVVGLFYGMQHLLTGHANPYAGDRKTFYWNYPFAAPEDVWERGIRLSNEDYFEQSFYFHPKTLVYNLYYYVFGRFTGILPYFCCALLALYYFVRRFFLRTRVSVFSEPSQQRLPRQAGMRRVFLLVTIGMSILAYIVMAPDNYQGGGGAFGNRFFLNIYPAFLFLITAMSSLWPLVVSWIVGSLFLAQTLIHPFQISAYPTPHTFQLPYQWLPVELTLLNTLPVRINTHLMQTQMDPHAPAYRLYFFDEHAADMTPYSFWVRGQKTAELALRTAEPMPYLALTITNGPIGNQVDVTVAGTTQTVIFAKPYEKKRLAFPLDGPLPYFKSVVYPLKIRSHSGFTPQFTPGSGLLDQRYLGCRVQVSLDLFYVGKAFLENGDLQQAIDMFEAVLGENPAHIQARYHLGVVYQQLGRPEAALQAFQQCKAFLPDFQRSFATYCQHLSEDCVLLEPPLSRTASSEAALSDVLQPFIRRFEAERFSRNTGIVRKQPSASNGRVTMFDAAQNPRGFMVYGQHAELPEGQYQARFRMSIESQPQTPSDPEQIALVYDVYSPQYGIIVRDTVTVPAAEDQPSGGYREYTLDFEIDRPTSFEFRVETTGTASVAVDRIDVYHRLPLQIFQGVAEVNLQMEDYEEAYEHFRQIIVVDSWNPTIQFEYLTVLFQLERWQEAWRFIQRSVRFSASRTGLLSRLFAQETPALPPQLQHFATTLASRFTPDIPVERNFGDVISLLGYSLSARQVAVGENFTIQYVWKALRPMDEDYTMFVHFTRNHRLIPAPVLAKIQRAVGIPVTTMFQNDHQPLHGTYPTSRWFAGELIREQYELTVPPNLEPGLYTIWIGLWNPLT
ncbi:tetratricopeptide repeat protein, partial [candidate division KSB3 bacterium]|nr:tetratricopeptide repeat protein [candidate division KSB3 bacterium]MBD3324036.1 tetratricopeptide repeat protein [candidate division KSB3 bacterium]